MNYKPIYEYKTIWAEDFKNFDFFCNEASVGGWKPAGNITTVDRHKYSTVTKWIIQQWRRVKPVDSKQLDPNINI